MCLVCSCTVVRNYDDDDEGIQLTTPTKWTFQYMTLLTGRWHKPIQYIIIDQHKCPGVAVKCIIHCRHVNARIEYSHCKEMVQDHYTEIYHISGTEQWHSQPLEVGSRVWGSGSSGGAMSPYPLARGTGDCCKLLIDILCFSCILSLYTASTGTWNIYWSITHPCLIGLESCRNCR